MTEPARLRIVRDDLSGPEIAEFLAGHLNQMRSLSPPESTHALDLDGLRDPAVTFWSVVDGEAVVGCGALKELDHGHAEIKSMRTAEGHQRRGIASLLLRHLLTEAEARGYTRLSLETGSMDAFAPARALYAKHGFRPCPPFAGYTEDPNSAFLSRTL